jgi:hypothetical protein
MDSSIAVGFIAAGSALAGAAITAAAFLLADWRGLRRSRRGMASAIAGEISGLLQGTAARKQAIGFQVLAQQLLSNSAPARSRPGSDERERADPVMHAHAGRIGELGGNLPERVARFYILLEILRADLRRLNGPEFQYDQKAAAALIMADIQLWQETERDAAVLVADLLKIAG